MNKTTVAILTYLGLGVVWLGLVDFALPPPGSGQPQYQPPGGVPGMLVLWPWSLGGFIYSYATQGIQPKASPT